MGVSPGTSLTGFDDSGGPGVAGGGTHIDDATAIAAQAEALIVFGDLDQPCDDTFGGGGLAELGGMTLDPGVYCAQSFGLTGTLTLTGGAEEVYIFKSGATLITAEGSQVVGGDPCNVWWQVGSSATLGAGSLMIGNVFSQTGVSAMNSTATLAGRFIGLEAVTITLNNNTITAPVCLVAEEATEEATEEPSEESTPVPETLPDTGGDLAGPGSQIIQLSLGALGLSLILFGVVLSRRTQKAER